MGLHAQRAILILTLFSIPVSIIWACTDKILFYFFFIDKEIATLSGMWARYIVFGLWPTLMFQIIRRFLQSCGIVWPIILANIMSTLSVIGGTYIMIYHFNWGFSGAAIGVILAQWVRFIVLSFITWMMMIYSRSHSSLFSLSLSLYQFPSYIPLVLLLT